MQNTSTRIIFLVLILGLVTGAAYFSLHPIVSTSSLINASTSTVDTVVNLPDEASSTAPTASTSTVGWEVGMQTITSQDNGQTIVLQKNERFIVQFGNNLNWKLAFNPSDNITRVPNTSTADGIQGTYEASKIGTVILNATGAPICKPDEACPQFMAVAKVTFIIK